MAIYIPKRRERGTRNCLFLRSTSFVSCDNNKHSGTGAIAILTIVSLHGIIFPIASPRFEAALVVFGLGSHENLHLKEKSQFLLSPHANEHYSPDNDALFGVFLRRAILFVFVSTEKKFLSLSRLDMDKWNYF
jgi:hypothetical protein